MTKKCLNKELHFSFYEISPIAVRDAINNPKNTPGKDVYDMNIPLLKYLKNPLIAPLTKIINLSIKEGIYPTCFKLTKVIPLHKQNDTNDPNDFRPISLIPVISKVLEYILKTQLTEYFESKNLFSDCQYGFKANKSTTKAILSFMEHSVEALEGGLIL